MAEWDQRDPLIRQKLRYCPLVMADLSAGKFVLVSPGVVDEVCCIVDCWEVNETRACLRALSIMNGASKSSAEVYRELVSA